MSKQLEQQGEADYDFEHDILFFKAKDRQYARSIEADNIVIDIDVHGFIIGVQVMNASAFFAVPKAALMRIPSWRMRAAIEQGHARVSIEFELRVRNKTYIKNPIIVERIGESLPDSELACVCG